MTTDYDGATYTEVFYVSATGDGTTPKSPDPAHCWGPSDILNNANWASVDAEDNKLGPNDCLVVFDNAAFTTPVIGYGSGLSGKPITIRQATGASPAFNYNGDAVFQGNGQSHITFKGLAGTRSGTAAHHYTAKSGNGTGIVFEDMTLTGTGTCGGLQIAAGASGTQILGNSVVTAAGGPRGVEDSGDDTVFGDGVQVVGDTGEAIVKLAGAGIDVGSVETTGGTYGLRVEAATGSTVIDGLKTRDATLSGCYLSGTLGTIDIDNIDCASNAGTANGLHLNNIFPTAFTCDNFRLDNNTGMGLKIEGTSAVNGGTGYFRAGSISDNGQSGLYTAGSMNGFEFGSPVLSELKVAARRNSIDGFSFNGASHDLDFYSPISEGNGTGGALASGDGYTAHDNCYNLTFYSPVSLGDRGAGIAMVGASHGEIYNLTVIGPDNPIVQDRGGLFIDVTGNNPTTGSSWTVKDSIVYNAAQLSVWLSSAAAPIVDLDNNRYYDPDKADGSVFASIDGGNTTISWATYHATYEANSEYIDPLVGSTGLITRESPCIGQAPWRAGINDQGWQDPWGYEVQGKPDIGAHQGARYPSGGGHYLGGGMGSGGLWAA